MRITTTNNHRTPLVFGACDRHCGGIRRRQYGTGLLPFVSACGVAQGRGLRRVYFFLAAMRAVVPAGKLLVGWPSSLVVNTTTRHLVVTGSIPIWVTTPARERWGSGFNSRRSLRPGKVWACDGQRLILGFEHVTCGLQPVVSSSIVVLPEPAHA